MTKPVLLTIRILTAAAMALKRLSLDTFPISNNLSNRIRRAICAPGSAFLTDLGTHYCELAAISDGDGPMGLPPHLDRSLHDSEQAINSGLRESRQNALFHRRAHKKPRGASVMQPVSFNPQITRWVHLSYSVLCRYFFSISAMRMINSDSPIAISGTTQ
jgi:hypothetical protein